MKRSPAGVSRSNPPALPTGTTTDEVGMSDEFHSRTFLELAYEANSFAT